MHLKLEEVKQASITLTQMPAKFTFTPYAFAHPIKATISQPYTLSLLRKVQVIAQPLPGVDLFHTKAWLAVRERQEEVPAPQHRSDDHTHCCPRREHRLSLQSVLRCLEGTLGLFGDSLLEVVFPTLDILVVDDGVNVEDEFDEGTGHESRGKVGR